MKPIVLDASIIIKWLKTGGESGLKEAHEYFIQNAQGKIQIHTPSLLIYEVHNTVARLTDKIPKELLTFLDHLEIQLHEPSPCQVPHYSRTDSE